MKSDLSTLIEAPAHSFDPQAKTGNRVLKLLKAWLKRFIRQWRAQNKEQVVLCVPRGGFNDMLCQIQQCLHYSETHDCILVVNARKSGMRDDLGAYFELVDPHRCIFLDDNTIRTTKLGKKDCIPRELCGRAHTYTSFYTADKNFCDSISGVPICFDRTIAHDAALLIHEQCGGGTDGWKVLERLRLRRGIRLKIIGRLSRLPVTYTSIHVRNTDAKTDYHRFFEDVQSEIASSDIVICTDSGSALEYAQRNIKAKKIINLNSIKRNDDLPLHDRDGFTNLETNIDLLTDLFALSLGRRMLLPTAKVGYPSGFAFLAQQLMQRPRLICQLLDYTPKQLLGPDRV